MSTPQNNRTLSHLADMRDAAVALWWGFFDWIARLSWGKLVLVWLAVIIISGPVLHLGGVIPIFLIVSIAIKILARGKLRAEVKASEATMRADVEALERRVLEAQLAALQAQVEPHFLFNTLALIGRLIETDPPEAAKIHNLLIQYLRTAIPQMRENGGATLERQIELARAYLTIMQARMKERLNVSIDVPAALGSASFPPMMLQSLVENAIKHGLEPKTEGGLITIRAYLEDQILCVEVSDNGMGFNPQSDDGLGLANLRERLKMLFNGQAKMLIEVPPQGGCRCTLRLPYQISEGIA